MSLARPKSQIFTMLLSDRRMFRAARSLWIHCEHTHTHVHTRIHQGRVGHCVCIVSTFFLMWTNPPLGFSLISLRTPPPTRLCEPALPSISLDSAPFVHICCDLFQTPSPWRELKRDELPGRLNRRRPLPTSANCVAGLHGFTFLEARNSIPRATWKL